MSTTHPRLYWALIALVVLLALACALLWPFPLLAAAPDPRLSARWDSAISATVQWTQAGRACLSVRHASGESAAIGCWEGRGRVVVTLGGPLTDGAYRPHARDVFVLTMDGATWRAPLTGRAQYLAVARR